MVCGKEASEIIATRPEPIIPPKTLNILLKINSLYFLKMTRSSIKLSCSVASFFTNCSLPNLCLIDLMQLITALLFSSISFLHALQNRILTNTLQCILSLGVMGIQTSD